MATVKVKALQHHTYNGKEYKPDDVYEIDEMYADSVVIQGKATREAVEQKPAPAPAPAVPPKK